MNLGNITISYYLDDSGDMITGVDVEGDVPLVTQLGLLELAKDTVIKKATGGLHDGEEYDGY